MCAQKCLCSSGLAGLKKHHPGATARALLEYKSSFSVSDCRARCRLNRGVVEIITDHTVCKVGQRLTPDQAAILRVFHIRMSSFRFTPVASWEKEGDLPPPPPAAFFLPCPFLQIHF